MGRGDAAHRPGDAWRLPYTTVARYLGIDVLVLDRSTVHDQFPFLHDRFPFLHDQFHRHLPGGGTYPGQIYVAP